MKSFSFDFGMTLKPLIFAHSILYKVHRQNASGQNAGQNCKGGQNASQFWDGVDKMPCNYDQHFVHQHFRMALEFGGSVLSESGVHQTLA